MDQYEEKISIELRKKDVLLIRNILAEICYGAHTMIDAEFETLLGIEFTREYVGKLCTFFRKTMEENDIVE